MPDTIPVDAEALRADVRQKYREVALHPDAEFHFHTGRPLAALLGYPNEVVDALSGRPQVRVLPGYERPDQEACERRVAACDPVIGAVPLSVIKIPLD